MTRLRSVKKIFAVIISTIILLSAALILLPGSAARAQAKTLYWGSRGSEVTVLQQKLKQWGYFHGFVDGAYGSATYRAVVDFQRKNGLRADGIVGPQTRAALGMGGGKNITGAGTTQYVDRGFWETSRDIQLLARVIEGEAADEPYSGKLAVGAVILNRVKSSAFPNTLSGVIYQPHAFESVTNGQYNRPLTSESLQAARQAMAGMDPTGGATFFWNPSKPVSPWIWSRNIITRIGRHVFAR
ncbi:N-acetylmuramoyl-L-alanine amidase [Desulfallas thermosapovorans DSM 6562]|uniref:Spore cortex-lytic enzyme n=1 Tax=Desulfallas thermosapovorans DSM 6562 TaxID=1121431 RepID=A0A5S4ZUF0_9FIRM|nr:spore cortex-lytic enzyme [Desulfallas thermosapovorans]TYO96519.1 N-acetylmuramoyl-L-alanine amidase [Desulfallas thermosapovorans DSM 6562]